MDAKSFSSFFSVIKSHSLDDVSTHDDFRDSSISVLELPIVESNADHQLNDEKHPVMRQSGFRMVYLSAMASMLSAASAGYIGVYPGPATFDMQTRESSRIKVTDDDVSWIGSVLPIGVITAIPIAVYLADRIGRKEALVFNAIPSLICWLITIYAPSPFYIMMGRFFGGWSLAICYVVLPMYAVEISSADTRGLIGASFHTCVSIGFLLSVGLGAFLTWSWLAVGGLVLVNIALIAFCPLPESPRWLIAKGMKEKAIETIQFLHANKIDAKQECQMIESNLQMQTKLKFSIQNFKQPVIYKPALISMAQMFFIQFSGSAVVLTFTSMIAKNAHSALDAKYLTVLVGAVQVVATVLSTLAMDLAGRRILLLASGLSMGISLGALGTYFYFYSYDSTVSSEVGWIPLACLLLYVAVFSVGYGPIPWLMLSEMAPTRERGFISGIATLFLSALGFVVNKTFENLIQLINFHGVFWTYSAFCFLSCLFVYLCVPETKGKQLEEIQLIFSGEQMSRVDASGRETKSPEESIEYSRKKY